MSANKVLGRVLPKCPRLSHHYRLAFVSFALAVTSFLLVVSRYQVDILNLAGSANVPSDFYSPNAPTYVPTTNPQCQVCSFICTAEDSVIRSTFSQSIHNVPCTCTICRSSWIQIQAECPNLRRTHGYFQQGTRPFTNLIVVPRPVLDGLVTALHIKLDHPSKHKLLMMMKRTFFA